MQASKITVEEMAAPNHLGWWRSFTWANKLPFACAFGFILALASPGFDQWWLAWCALAPFLVLLALCRSRNEALLCGFCFGFSYHLLSLSWYLNLYPLHWLGVDNWLAIQAVAVLWILESAHESLLMVGFAWLAYSLPVRPGFLTHYERPFFPQLLSLPIIWVFFQWLIGSLEAFWGIPTDQLAYSQFRETGLIQLTKLAGPGFVDFLIVMVNAALAACLLELPNSGQRPVDRLDRLPPRVGAVLDLGVALFVVACVVAWGNTEVEHLENGLASRAVLMTRDCLPRLPVAVLQNNISVEQEHLNTTSPAEIAQLYEDLGSNLGVGLLVLPEGAVNKTHTPNQPLLDMLKARAQVEKKEVLVGCIETLAGNLVNAAYIIGPDRKDRGIYVKHRLFPLLEFMPWRSITEELPESIKRKIPAVRDAFLSTKETQLLSSAWARIGASISTEIIYPRLIAQEVREGAGLLVNIADLSQFHNSLLNRQILAAAAFRAVENGRYVILSSNTGISAVIDPAGVIQSASLAGRRGTLVDTVQFLCEKTLFTKMWWL